MASRVLRGKRPVKPFSILGRAFYCAVFLYGGWFLANAVLHLRESSGAPQAYGAATAKAFPEAALLILAWLLLAAGVAGSILSLRALIARRPGGAEAVARAPSLHLERRLAAGLLVALAVLHVRICAADRVQVRGDSMAPTLRDGESLWVERLSAGFRLPRLDFPLGSPYPAPYNVTGVWPAFGLQLYGRGDVVVLRLEGLTHRRGDRILKRVIGLPGDRYEFRAGRVWMNGAPLDEPYLAPEARTATRPDPPDGRRLYTRTPEALELVDERARYAASFGLGASGVIPPGTVLVLGDARQNSQDSRSFGFVPTFLITGRAIGLDP